MTTPLNNNSPVSQEMVKQFYSERLPNKTIPACQKLLEFNYLRSSLEKLTARVTQNSPIVEQNKQKLEATATILYKQCNLEKMQPKIDNDKYKFDVYRDFFTI